MTERQRPDINQNIMPHFNLIPHPLEIVARQAQRIGRGVLGLFTVLELASHNDHLPSSTDEMLLGEYWQPELDYDTEE